MSASRPLRWLVLASMAVHGLAALAQAAPSREQEQIRRLRLQVQQLQQEQSNQQSALQQAQARNNDLKAKVETAEAVLQSARAAAGERARALGTAQQEMSALRAESAALSASRDETQALLQASARDLQALRSEQARLQSTLTQRDAAVADLAGRLRAQATGLQSCIDNNQALHALGTELLMRYAEKGVFETAAQAEPFLQLGRVRLENLVRGYRDKLDQQALAPASAASAVREPVQPR